MVRFIVISVLLSSPFALLANSMSYQDQFIQSISPAAIDMMVEHRIPASVTMAQAIHESNYGKSELAAQANNYFGMQCGSITAWSGNCYRKVDYDAQNNAYAAQFRMYTSIEECFDDRVAFLNKKRYRHLFDLDIANHFDWIKGLYEAGYAEDPAYTQKLNSIINRHNLKTYDKKGLAIINKSSETLLAQTQEPELFYARSKTYDVFPSTYMSGIYNQNNVKMVVAAPGMTLDEIAKNTGRTEKKLREFNDMTDSQFLIPFQYVFLSPKKTISKVAEIHTVRKDETMYVIAQAYGIQLEHLLALNKMTRGQLPAKGEIIELSKQRKTNPKIRIPLKKEPKNSNAETVVSTNSTKPTLDHRPTAKPNPVYPSFENAVISTRQMHLVKKGDTVYSICRKYKISKKQLDYWNNLNSTIININELLFVESD